MQRFIGIILFVLDVILIPVGLLYYILFSLSLICGCISSKGNLKTEIKDFNEVVINCIKNGLSTHAERIFRV